MASREAALALLNRDPIRNISIINFLEARPSAQILQFGDSVLARGEEGIAYISAQNEHELEQIIAVLDERDKFLTSLEDWVAERLGQNRDIKIYPHKKYILPLDAQLPEQKHPVSPLAPEYFDMVATHWLEDEDDDEEVRQYVLHCLSRFPSAAVYVDGEPVSWAGIHEDGAIGFLYTREEHRGNSYAYSISINLIKQQRAQGKISYVLIEEGRKSLGLASKLGFVHAGSSCWVDFRQ